MNDEFIQSQIEHDRGLVNYRTYLEKEKIDYYDKDFVNFFREGKMVINDKEYKVTDLYLESGLTNNQKRILLVYYRFPQKDLLTQEEKSNFKRTSIVEFRCSSIFFKIFKQYKEDIIDNILKVTDNNFNTINGLVRSYDGLIHTETPETSYNVVKPRYQMQKE